MTEINKKQVKKLDNKENTLNPEQIIVDIYLPKIIEKYLNGGKECLTKKEQILLCMFTSSKRIANELAEGDEILMEFNKEVERLENDAEFVEAYNRAEERSVCNMDETQFNF